MQERLHPAQVVVIVLLAIVIGQVLAKRPGAAPPAPVTPWKYRITEAEAKRDQARVLTPTVRDATFAFEPGSSPYDQQAFLDAVTAGIRPEAQQLIGLVDGLVTVGFGAAHDGALGHAGPNVRGRYEVVLDMPVIMREIGRRGLQRAAVHELGHVVDSALLTPELQQELNAQIPVGYQCPPGSRISACAPREERFAETFAKWATGDLGIGLYAGYAIMPPNVTLDVWGKPLSELAAG